MMCMGTPDIPTPPERQDAKAPARDATGLVPDPMKRRRGYMALMQGATAGGAALTPVSTTATAAKQSLGA